MLILRGLCILDFLGAVLPGRKTPVIVLDNLSVLPAAVQDDLGRLATGGGIGGRKLYTNDGDASFNASRPVIMTGINNLATRGDLADRSIVIHLEKIPDTGRRRGNPERVRGCPSAHAGRAVGYGRNGLAPAR